MSMHRQKARAERVLPGDDQRVTRRDVLVQLAHRDLDAGFEASATKLDAELKPSAANVDAELDASASDLDASFEACAADVGSAPAARVEGRGSTTRRAGPFTLSEAHAILGNGSPK